MKEYLLLRNNIQSGPYTLFELKELGLRAFDLIWVERESFSWRYPSELDELAAFAPAAEDFGNPVINFSIANAPLKIADQTYVNDQIVAHQKAPIRHLNHIVTIEPKIDHVHVKTIKPTAQPNLVKVEIREKEARENENISKNAGNSGTTSYTNHAAQHLPGTIAASPLIQPDDVSNGSGSRWSRLGFSLLSNNKMEMIVLLVSAASLLAVAYLFITTGY